jgi:plastocyanin
MKRVISSFFIIAVALALSGCSLYGSKPAQNNNPSTVNKQDGTVESNTVSIQNFAFNPQALTVKKGTTVTWTNNDSAPHQIKSTTFNSQPLGKGQSYSFTFDNPGTFDYICGIHPSMTGKIIVQ